MLSRFTELFFPFFSKRSLLDLPFLKGSTPILVMVPVTYDRDSQLHFHILLVASEQQRRVNRRGGRQLASTYSSSYNARICGTKPTCSKRTAPNLPQLSNTADIASQPQLRFSWATARARHREKSAEIKRVKPRLVSKHIHTRPTQKRHKTHSNV